MNGRYSIKYRCRGCNEVFTKEVGAESGALAAGLRELTDGKNATALAQGDEPPITLRIMEWHACPSRGARARGFDLF